MTHLTPYLSSFNILSSDFRTMTEYIEPTENNLNTYSHRLYELLLRSCTDFESVCKDTLVAGGYSKPPGDMNVLDYKSLESSLSLQRYQVGVLLWQPVAAYITPFHRWSSASPPLDWYSAYNSVKHNRNSAFSKASLATVRTAVAGLFAILAVLDVIPKNQPGVQERTAPNGLREYVYPGQFFTLAWQP